MRSPTGPNGVMNGSRPASMFCRPGWDRADRWRRHQHEHRNQRREEEQLVGERIEQAPEIGDQVPRARELAVVVVGDGGDDVENERNSRAPGEAMNGSAAMKGAARIRPAVMVLGRFTRASPRR